MEFGHGDQTGDALCNFSRNNWEIVFDLGGGGGIGTRQYVENKLEQFSVLQGCLATGLQRAHTLLVRFGGISRTLETLGTLRITLCSS